MADRLSYRDFRDEFLLAFAVTVKADTARHVDPLDVAARINHKFQPSWIMAAVRELETTGLIRGKLIMDGGGSFRLTGPGLDRAEELAEEAAGNLYELIDESDAPDRENIDEPPPSKVVQIDHLSEAFRSLDTELRERIEELRSDNRLMAEGGAEASQRLAELEAGKRLLNADQADAGLLQRVLLQSLKWFAKMVRDETAKDAIQRVIKLVLDFTS